MECTGCARDKHTPAFTPLSRVWFGLDRFRHDIRVQNNHYSKLAGFTALRLRRRSDPRPPTRPPIAANAEPSLTEGTTVVEGQAENTFHRSKRIVKRSPSSIRTGSVPLCSFMHFTILRGMPMPECSR